MNNERRIRFGFKILHALYVQKARYITDASCSGTTCLKQNSFQRIFFQTVSTFPQAVMLKNYVDHREHNLTLVKATGKKLAQ